MTILEIPSNRGFVEHWARIGDWLNAFRTLEDRVENGIASPSELVVLKSFTAREEDWEIVRNVVTHEAKLNWGQISCELTRLCAFRRDLSSLERLAAIRREVERNG